ncbi:hypothetical protein [Pseudomonas fluorescens]|uniref:hypothetical protein n=1 Tax=Pseudomonas fluorescens TaxID=294 RepID=UPI00178145FF|nr:hypothetical protein [Pseudomonas fluorescens]
MAAPLMWNLSSTSKHWSTDLTGSLSALSASKQAWVLADPPIKEAADDPRTARAAH